jgi:DNA-binding LytR/AlgR family response regulator
MTKISTVIIDDEVGAHKVLGNYIQRIPQLELTGNSYNVIEAEILLKENQVDLIFLDITLPELTGFDLLKRIDKPPFVIFTTAHSDFALESYEYNAVDYLKKPIPFDRFSKAIAKLLNLIERGIDFKPEKRVMDFKVKGKTIALFVNEIEYLQSMGNYVKIITDSKAYVTQITTAELETILPHSLFLRIHKSYIVNRHRVESITDEYLVVAGNKLPVGKTFKRYVKEQLHYKNPG